MKETFDYIVIGGGSSGCVVAARLSENPKVRVLLIECGRKDNSPFIHIPATFFKVLEKGRDVVVYKSNHGDPNSFVVQGRVLGGGSSVNGMVYIRGQAEDYNSWAQMGNLGWSFEDVLPVYRDLEHNELFSDSYHGDSGELYVSEPRHKHPLCSAFVRAAQEVGIPYNPDFNGVSQEGVGFYQTTTKNGRRWSAARAFLEKSISRENLTVWTGTKAAKVLFDENRASAVLLENGRTVNARSEIILCSGAIETPRLLQLSGVGPADHLRTLGIDVVADLPGVGSNYQDHLKSTVQGETLHPVSIQGQDVGLKAVRNMAQYLLTRTGLLTSNVIEAGGFVDVSGVGQPDVQFHVLPVLTGLVGGEPLAKHGIAISPNFLRPKSRGSVRLKSNDFRDDAKFDPGMLSHEDDLEVLVRGVQKSIEILEAPSLAKLVKRRLIPEPGIEHNLDELRNYVKRTANTTFHPVGTAKMGRVEDSQAVVDHELRVHKLKGLRVADASIMPTLVSGNTNAPAMMIGERCARFIAATE